MDSLFDLPASAVDLPTVVSFLRVPIETVTTELKETWSQGVLPTIAAFANTSGGLLFIGVKENATVPDSLVGVDIEQQLRVQNACRGRLEPPVQPEIIPVPLTPSGRVILVVRVNPEILDRPVVMDGKVYVRQSGGNIGADRVRMQALFAEERSLAPFEFSGNAHPRFFYGEDYQPDGPDFTCQVSIGLPLRRNQRAGLMFAASFRRELVAALERSRIQQWFVALMSYWGLEHMNDWQLYGPLNSSTSLDMTRAALLPNRDAAFRVHCLANLSVNQLTLSIAAAFLNRKAENAVREMAGKAPLDTDGILEIARLRLEDLHYFFQAAMETLWVTLPEDVLSTFVQPPPWRALGPIARAAGRNDRTLASWLSLGVPDKEFNSRSGDDFLAELDVRVSEREGREALSRFWIEKLLLDLGAPDADYYMGSL